MNNIWVIADVPDHAYELLSKVAGKADQITAFVNGDQAVANECFSYGANAVKLLPLQANTTWEQYGKAIVNEAKTVQPELLVVAATRRGKTLSAYVAAFLNVPCLTESKHLEIEGNKVSTSRTIYGGLAEKEVEVEQPLVISFASGTFEKQKAASPGSGNVSTLELTDGGKVQIIERKEKEVSAVNLNEANIVIGVGRGFGSQEQVKLAEDLATALGGEVACSRPVAEDFHWLGIERYLGISGAVIKPTLYLAAGISGQVQHIYGVRDAKTIVAIDKNESAPIFKVSDYYIVGDLNEILPELIAAVK